MNNPIDETFALLLKDHRQISNASIGSVTNYCKAMYKAITFDCRS